MPGIKAKGRALTDLEGNALGHIIRHGRCTPYTVKEAFRMSPSAFWSGSAGAVYPLVERLVQRRYLRAVADEADGRARRVVSATAAGKAAFFHWLLDAKRASDLGFDPLRSRLVFADLLPNSELDAFLKTTADLLAVNTEPPLPHLPHVVRLHRIWLRLRRHALKAFSLRGSGA